ncbi:energy transducer TonB [Terriglobus albidus]|nr:energy transducer TonB [Terriglobus albidus]
MTRYWIGGAVLAACTMSLWATEPACKLDEPILSPGNGITSPELRSALSLPSPPKGSLYVHEVVVEFLVDSHGIPRCLRVTHPSGYGIDTDALNAIRQSVFRPAHRADGTPVAVKMTQSFHLAPF